MSVPRSLSWPRLGSCLAVTLAIIGAGCGDSSSPEDHFAEEACSITATWAREIVETYDEVTLQSPRAGSEGFEVLTALVMRGLGNVNAFQREIRELSAPDTEAGRQATRWLERSVDRSVQVMSELGGYVRGLPDSITLAQSRRALLRLESDLIRVGFEMKAVPDPIRMFVPELRQAFEMADSCRELETVGTG